MTTTHRNARLSAVRAILHDLVCQSDHCSGDNDHARRTQHQRARRIVDAPAADQRAVASLAVFELVFPGRTIKYGAPKLKADHPTTVALAAALGWES
jgi:hypothetical protein